MIIIISSLRLLIYMVASEKNYFVRIMDIILLYSNKLYHDDF